MAAVYEVHVACGDCLICSKNIPATSDIINRSISSCTFLLTGRISSDSEGR